MRRHAVVATMVVISLSICSHGPAMSSRLRYNNDMKSTTQQPLAAFDLDGTLFRWQLFHELVFELKDQNMFDSETSRDIEQALNKWQGKEFGWNEYENIFLTFVYGSNIMYSTLHFCADM